MSTLSEPCQRLSYLLMLSHHCGHVQALPTLLQCPESSLSDQAKTPLSQMLQIGPEILNPFLCQIQTHLLKFGNNRFSTESNTPAETVKFVFRVGWQNLNKSSSRFMFNLIAAKAGGPSKSKLFFSYQSDQDVQTVHLMPFVIVYTQFMLQDCWDNRRSNLNLDSYNQPKFCLSK